MSGDHNMNQKSDSPNWSSYKQGWEDGVMAEQQQSDRVLFQAQTAAIALTKQLEIYEAALESIIMMQPESLEATKAKQALAQARGVEV